MALRRACARALSLAGPTSSLAAPCEALQGAGYAVAGGQRCAANNSLTRITRPCLDTWARNINGISRIVDHEKGKTKFNGFYAGGFYVNNVQVPGSVLAQADIFLLWRPRTMAEVTPESLVFLELITPAPDILVLGCGASPEPLPKDVAAYLAARKLKVEVLNSKDASGYFNVLNEEGRIVVGALLAIDPDEPLLEHLPEQKDPLYERPFLQQ